MAIASGMVAPFYPAAKPFGGSAPRPSLEHRTRAIFALDWRVDGNRRAAYTGGSLRRRGARAIRRHFTGMNLLTDLFGDIGGLVRALLAIPAALLPRRRWDTLSGLPIKRVSFLSALVTLAVGVAIGVDGFLAYAQAAADALTDATLATATKLAANPKGPDTVPILPSMMASGLSPLLFLVATPTGWLTLYLVIGAVLRAIGAWFDDPLGDPLLTGLDHVLTRGRDGARDSRSRRDREREEGPEVPDQLYRAEWAGVTDADLVVVASRRKPDWTRGTFVITSDKWYTLGEPFDLRVRQGLRTVYPLTEQKVCEVLRRGVSYELPRLQAARARTSLPPRTPRGSTPTADSN
jgi:hypothetical protein